MVVALQDVQAPPVIVVAWEWHAHQLTLASVAIDSIAIAPAGAARIIRLGEWVALLRIAIVLVLDVYAALANAVFLLLLTFRVVAKNAPAADLSR